MSRQSGSSFFRSPYRIAVYVLVAGGAIIGLVWLGWSAIQAPRTPSANTNGARATSSTHDRFQEVYDLGWRFDGQAGNTAVDAIYEWPGFVQRLAEYAERSPIQAEMLQFVQAESDPSLVPFWISLQSNAPIGQIEWATVAQLKADAAEYRFERFDVSSYPSGRDDLVQGLVWFRRSGPVDPNVLTLTLRDVIGNAKPSVFSWDVKALRLYDATPIDLPS